MLWCYVYLPCISSTVSSRHDCKVDEYDKFKHRFKCSARKYRVICARGSELKGFKSLAKYNRLIFAYNINAGSTSVCSTGAIDSLPKGKLLGSVPHRSSPYND
ncbi:putative tagatose-6-phosphate kinase [Trichinella spiralis]|uniref:putative tagatose-6-phosphate kinase n=1 Tax=Trichinella spiralis TaxID=6334 RepID=UPI0001EFC4CD|nr:putative tagatose-6-phosphate kinase [Trichinella spiralis]